MELITDFLAQFGLTWQEVVYMLLYAGLSILVVLYKKFVSGKVDMVSTINKENQEAFAKTTSEVSEKYATFEQKIVEESNAAEERLKLIVDEAIKKLEAAVAENDKLKEAIKILTEEEQND